MGSIRIRLGGAAVASLLCMGVAAPAHALTAPALTAKQCSAKYQAAKQAGTLGGASLKDFRARQCVSDTQATAPAAPATSAGKTATPAAQATGPATFPSAIDPKYSKETPGKAREKTCQDQYHANNANGGLKWVQKGGGYYSACNKKLKG